MKKIFLLGMFIMMSVFTYAETVKIDGVYYNLVSKIKEAEVTHGNYLEGGNDSQYQGDIIIPESVVYNNIEYVVTSIGDAAFRTWDKNKITSIKLPNTIKKIGAAAFSACDIISSLEIPASVEEIGENAFSGCSLLKTINLPEKLNTIQRYTFENCINLQAINIPERIATIEMYAFSGCSSLKEILFPNGVSVIGKGVMSNCTNLEYVELPHGIDEISDNMFSSCSNLKYISIPTSVKTIGEGAFYYCSNLESVDLPQNLLSIEEAAFLGCSSISNLTIPETVTTIKARSFVECKNLKTIVIGKKISKIEDLAFADCVSIENVYCYNKDIPNTSTNVFENSLIEFASLHVPTSSLSKYKITEPWKDFGTIIKIDIPEHILTYMIDGDLYKSYIIEEGESITPESAPTKEGYTFSGWSDIPETMPDHDVTVTGTFSINKYKLTYTVDGEEYKSYDVEYGAVITSEPAPTKEGYTFSGWSDIPETMPDHNVTITGSFTVNKYKLIYKVDGADYKTYELEYGATIIPEAVPAKEGYTFNGWSEIPKTMPAHDVTVTGTFTKGNYKLTYMVNGEVYKTVSYDYGDVITPEPTPEREGYSFIGWSEIPETMPAHDVTVTGTFSINSYKLTYMIDDKVYKEAMYEYGATITPEPQPEGDYATFEWIDLPQTMPANDVVVYASYTSGIVELQVTRRQNVRIYSPNGKRLNTFQKGVNIIRMNDGKTKKIVVK